MALPEIVRVRVIPDGAGYVDTNRVGHSEIPFPKLLEMVVAVVGLDPSRIGTILRAGTVTLGANRYRWQPIAVDGAEITPLLEFYPKADPLRPFDASRCLLARIRAGVETIDLPREMATRRRHPGVLRLPIRRRRLQEVSFWDVLMAAVSAHIPRYDTYSYREGADLYSADLNSDDECRLRQAAPLLAVDRTAEQVAGLPLDRVILYVKRG